MNQLQYDSLILFEFNILQVQVKTKNNYEGIIAVLQKEIDNQLDRNVNEAIGMLILFLIKY